MISKTIDIVVTSVLQTTAGKMIFGRFIEPASAAQAPRRRPRRTVATGTTRRRRAGVRDRDVRSAADLTRLAIAVRDSSVSLVADGLLPDPRHQRLHDRARHASLVSSLFDRRGDFAHGCARAWSWLILATTGVRVRRRRARAARARHAPTSSSSNHQSIYDIPVVFASLP